MKKEKKNSMGLNPCTTCSCYTCVSNYANSCPCCELCQKEGKAMANYKCTEYINPASAPTH